MMPESTSRWIASLILLVLTILGGIGPIYLINWLIRVRRRRANAQLPVATSKAPPSRSSGNRHVEMMRCLTQIGGGVLLYTSLIHMLPEIRDNFRELVRSENSNSTTTGEHIPWSFLFWNFESDSGSVPPVVDVFACLGFFGIFFIEQLAHCLLKEHSHDNNKSAKGRSPSHVPLQQAKENTMTSEQSQAQNDQHHDTPEVEDNGRISTKRALFDCFLLILAFSCHSIFDGIAIGVQNGSKIWSLLIAILSHKLLIAFVLCHQIHVKALSSGSKRMANITLWFFGIAFAFLSPIGIILVQIITGGTPSEDNMTVILLASVSAGTLLYIVFMEIIFRSRDISGSKQLSALVIGFAVMHVISQFFQD